MYLNKVFKYVEIIYKYFSYHNVDFLIKNNIEPIDWKIKDI